MQTHSRFNTAWDVARERQRGTWMKEEASHRGFGWKRVRDWEKEEDRERGEVFMRRGGKKADYLGSFCETEALAPSTCLDIVLTTMPVRQKQSWWNLWVVLLWISQQHSLCNGTVVLAALQKINRTQHNKDTCVYPVWQPCNKCLLCEVDMFQLLVILYGHRLHVTGVSLLCMQAACLCVCESLTTAGFSSGNSLSSFQLCRISIWIITIQPTYDVIHQWQLSWVWQIQKHLVIMISLVTVWTRWFPDGAAALLL